MPVRFWCFCCDLTRGQRTTARMYRSLATLLSILLLASKSATPATLRIYQIDVEQGSSTLILSPGGHTLLVDSGRNGHGSQIKAAMEQAAVSQIDYLVDTHYHDDHYGGIDELVSQFGVVVAKSPYLGDYRIGLRRKPDNLVAQAVAAQIVIHPAIR